MVDKIIRSRYFLLWSIAFIVMCLSLIFVLDPLEMNTSYSRTVEAITLGKLTPENFASGYLARILTSPVVVYLPLGLSYLIGNFYLNLLIINIIFYFIAIWFFYRMVILVYQDVKVALIASFLFFTNSAIIYFGIRPAADMSGWAFLIMANYFSVKYFYQPEKIKNYLLAIVMASIGVLFKEYAVLGMLTLATLIIFSQRKLVDKMFKIFLAGILFLIIPGLYHSIFYLTVHYDYSSWFAEAARHNVYNLTLFVKVMGSLYLFGWFYFFYGLYQEYRHYQPQRATVLLGLVPAAFAFLGWPNLLQRVAFVAVPLLAMISGFGLAKIRSNIVIVILLLLYAVTQFYMKDILVMVNI